MVVVWVVVIVVVLVFHQIVTSVTFMLGKAGLDEGKKGETPKVKNPEQDKLF